MSDVLEQYSNVVEKGLMERFDGITAVNLADAMEAGAQASEQAYGWGDGMSNACALHGAYAVAVNAAVR